MTLESKKKRVLIVDDNRDAADVLAVLVRYDGHCVRVAYDTQLGIDLAHEKLPDVIIHDIGMPIIDGYQAAQQLRGNKIFENTVLVGLSAYDSDINRGRALNSGFDLLLEKPIDYAELSRVLQKTRAEFNARRGA